MAEDDESAIPQTPENLALIKTATERVVARMARGESPPRRELPLSKADFPKLLCLDQNKWIELARAHYQRPDGAPFADALAAIREGITQGRLIVPVMPSNLIEVSEPKDEGRRERLAAFMIELSGNCSMLNPKVVEPIQLKQAITRQFLQKDSGPFPRHRLVAWGMAYALGRRLSQDLIGQALEEPEVSVLSMVHAMDRAAIAEGRALDEQAEAAALKARAAGQNEDDRRVAELYNLFLTTGATVDALGDVVKKLGVDPKAFSAWLANNLVAFAEDVPDACVVSRILLARDRSTDNKTHRNDLKDFTFLKLAVPYGNIVVTENLWAHLACQEGLDRKYQTSVTADLRGLPKELSAHGCV